MNKMFGFLAVAGLLLAGMSMDGAQALSLSNPVAAGTAKYASEGFTTEVRGGGHRGGGGRHFGGGGRHFGGGFRGGDLPPLKWSSLKYIFRMEDEIDGKEEAYG